MSDLSCDWLTVSEDHRSGAPRCFERFTVDELTGELLPRGLEPVQVKGLLGSSVRLWSDGSLVRFSGNPSRWNRSEAVFGLSVSEAKMQVNRILADAGFPPFSESAEISRVDLTRNFAVGSRLAEYQRILQTMQYGRLRMSTNGANTYWGAHSRHRQLRAYAKGPEVRTHLSEHDHGSDERSYLHELGEWLEKRGALRVELELGRALDRLCMTRLGLLDDAKASELFDKEVLFMSKVKRLDLGELEALPIRLLGVLMVHLSGVNVRDKMGATAFKAAKRALKAYGYDISQPVTTPFVPKAVYIDLEPLEVPDFAISRLPKPQLKLRAVTER